VLNASVTIAADVQVMGESWIPFYLIGFTLFILFNVVKKSKKKPCIVILAKPRQILLQDGGSCVKVAQSKR